MTAAQELRVMRDQLAMTWEAPRPLNDREFHAYMLYKADAGFCLAVSCLEDKDREGPHAAPLDMLCAEHRENILRGLREGNDRVGEPILRWARRYLGLDSVRVYVAAP